MSYYDVGYDARSNPADEYEPYMVECDQCEGEGRVTCEWCEGVGSYLNTDEDPPEMNECFDCRASGYRPCDKCDGSGERAAVPDRYGGWS